MAESIVKVVSDTDNTYSDSVVDSETTNGDQGDNSQSIVKDEPTCTSPGEENEFSQKSERDDLILKVEGKPLHVNKAVLSVFSQFFADMLYSDGSNASKDKIELKGKKYKDVLEFLRCMYPNILKPVTIDNVYVVSALAREYNVKILKNSCELCLLAHVSDKRNKLGDIYNVLEEACAGDYRKVKQKCIDVISQESHHQYMEAVRSFVFSDDVGNQIRKKMLQDLQLKYPDVFGQVQTSRALCRYLGIAAKQKDLLNRFLNGQVIGDYTKLIVKSNLQGVADMLIDDVPITVEIRQLSNKTFKAKFACNVSKFKPLSCLCVVQLVSRSQYAADKTYSQTHQFTQSNNVSDLVMHDFTTQTFIDTNGNVEVQLFVFKYL